MAAGLRQGKDPRREKLLNFRHQGKSCSSRSCVWCRGEKMAKGGRRLASKLELKRSA